MKVVLAERCANAGQRCIGVNFQALVGGTGEERVGERNPIKARTGNSTGIGVLINRQNDVVASATFGNSNVSTSNSVRLRSLGCDSLYSVCQYRLEGSWVDASIEKVLP